MSNKNTALGHCTRKNPYVWCQEVGVTSFAADASRLFGDVDLSLVTRGAEESCRVYKGEGQVEAVVRIAQALGPLLDPYKCSLPHQLIFFVW